MKISVTQGKCSLFVVGFDMQCPLCHAHVRSGQHHECEIGEPKEPPRKRKRA